MTTGLEPIQEPKRHESQPPPETTASLSEPYHEMIAEGLSRGRNAISIWQELVDRHGFPGAYQSVRRYVRKLNGPSSKEARVVIRTAPGEEAQVDYGTGPSVCDPNTGKYRRSRLFVMTPGYSCKCVRLTRRSCEDRRARQLGRRRARARFCDPALNPLYRDVVHHYGAVAMPCKIADPDRKGKVELGFGHAQKTPLKGQRFESMEEAQTHFDHWEERWADKRIHGTTKRQVAAMFAEEKPSLILLPLEPFRYYRYGENFAG